MASRNPISIVNAINTVLEADNNISLRTINSTSDYSETISTIFKKHLNIFDVTQTYEKNTLPKNPIITTFVHELQKERISTYQVYKRQKPLIMTEVCIINFDEEQAILDAMSLAEDIEESLEGFDNNERLVSLISNVARTMYVNKIERLGILKYSETGFHGVCRLHYKIDYLK